MLNFACIELLNLDESCSIYLFVITMKIMILPNSHKWNNYSTTLILVKGKWLSAGESSKAFTFARKSHRNEIEISRIACDVQLSFLGWNFHTLLVFTRLWKLSNFGVLGFTVWCSVGLQGLCKGEFELFPITSQSFARFGFYCVRSVNCEGYISRWKLNRLDWFI